MALRTRHTFSARCSSERAVGSDGAVRTVQVYLLPLAAIFILAASVRRCLLKREKRIDCLPALTLFAAFLGLLAAHALVGLKYPLERTGLYFVPLFLIAWAVAIDTLTNKTLRRLMISGMTLLAVQFATQLQTESFGIWKFDNDTKHIALLLKNASAGKPGQSQAVSTRWLHQPALEFYRQALEISALKPILWHDEAPLSGFDYYVLQDVDPLDVNRAGLRVLFSGADTRAVLAADPRTLTAP